MYWTNYLLHILITRNKNSCPVDFELTISYYGRIVDELPPLYSISSGSTLFAHAFLRLSGQEKYIFAAGSTLLTQVNRMSKSRRVLATGGKQRSFGLHMICFEMVLYHNEPH